MTESSHLRDRRCGGEDPVVAQECPHHVDSSAGQGADRLNMLEHLATPLEIEVGVSGAEPRGDEMAPVTVRPRQSGWCVRCRAAVGLGRWSAGGLTPRAGADLGARAPRPSWGRFRHGLEGACPGGALGLAVQLRPEAVLALDVLCGLHCDGTEHGGGDGGGDAGHHTLRDAFRVRRTCSRRSALLLAVHADHRVASIPMVSCLLIQVVELGDPVGVLGTFDGLGVGLQAEAFLPQQVGHRVGGDPVALPGSAPLPASVSTSSSTTTATPDRLAHQARPAQAAPVAAPDQGLQPSSGPTRTTGPAQQSLSILKVRSARNRAF